LVIAPTCVGGIAETPIGTSTNFGAIDFSANFAKFNDLLVMGASVGGT
jgi:hypothetical protein